LPPSPQFRTALHDIFVLSLMDDLVLTSESTFGYIRYV
jgi:hypothetical protein